MQRRLGERLLRDPGAQLRLRNQRRCLRAVGADHLPLRAVDHHRDDLFQIEAIFMGQAGLLELNTIPERYQKDALNDGYFSKIEERISLSLA